MRRGPVEGRMRSEWGDAWGEVEEERPLAEYEHLYAYLKPW